MKRYKYALILIVIVCSSFGLLHKFYVSVTQVEFNASKQSLQIISRVFVDDIETVLRERYDTSLRLAGGTEAKALDTYLKNYYEKKLIITVDGKPVQFHFIGKEYEDDLLISYLEVENVAALDQITISNTMLMDFFEEQQNIIHVKKGKQRKSLILEKEKHQGVLKFRE